MHRLLKRQLKKVGITPATPPNPEQWRTFLARIQQTYRQTDQERYTLERSLHISSEEMAELYQALQEASQSQLAHERQKLRQAIEIIEDSPTVIFTWENSANWPVLFVSENVKAIFGYTATEFLSGKLVYQDIIHPDDLERVTGEVRENSSSLETIRFAHLPYRIITKNGQVRWLDDRTRIRRDEQGQITHYQGTVLDITEGQSARETKETLEKKLVQAQKMEAIGMMAGGVAHDLNNILSGVVSYPELLLLQLPDDNPMRHALEVIKKSGQRAAEVVADLLTVARGVAGKRDVRSLNDLIFAYLTSPEGQKMLSLFPNVRIRTSLLPDLLYISCSSIHIKKCLMNLLTNSAEAIAGAGNILIETENRYIDKPVAGSQYLEKGEYAVVRITDDGQGIKEEDINHIFEPFYTKKVMGRSGTGLGLAIVWTTMQEHQGGVTVTNRQPGTSFELYFPITRETLKDKKQQLKLTQLKGQGEVLLVVDDDQLQREIAAQMLTALGYCVETVDSGEAAINFVRNRSVDLLVLDMIMDPGINGRETYERILQVRPGQRAIIASGFSVDEEVKQTRLLGANSFISKPYTIEQLGTAVQNGLAAGSK